MQTNILELRPSSPPFHRYEPKERTHLLELRDIDAAANAIERQARQQNLRVMVWHDLGTLEPMVDGAGDPLNATIFGWSEDELSPWHDNAKVRLSPLIAAARVASDTFMIDHHGVRSSVMNCLLEDIDLTDFEEQTGLTSAIVVPIHMAFGQIGMAIFEGRGPGNEHLSSKLRWVADRLGPMVARLVSSYAAINADERYLPVNTVLSPREIECLNWVAQGKTDHEISIILGCSHAGVRYHLARVGVKFGSANRTQSVFRACQLGYLSSPSKGR